MFVPANRVKVAIPTTGTGSPIDLGSAVVGFQSLAASGVVDTDQIRYIIEDGAAWELSSGTVSDTVSKVTRTVLESSNGGAAINLSGNAVLYVVFAGEDVVQPGQLATVATSGDYADLTGKPALFSGSYTDLSDVPLSFNPQTHNHDIEDVTGLQTALDGKAATSHTHTLANITDSGAMAALAEATAGEIRALNTGALGVTTRRLRDAAALVTISGDANWTPDWTAFVSAEWNVTANRTINNPTVVLPGITRSVKIRGSSSTNRIITWGSAYKGNVPDDFVDSGQFLFVTMTPMSLTEIVVSHLVYAP